MPTSCKSTARCSKCCTSGALGWLPIVALAMLATTCAANLEEPPPSQSLPKAGHLRGIHNVNVRGPQEGRTLSASISGHQNQDSSVVQKDANHAANAQQHAAHEVSKVKSERQLKQESKQDHKAKVTTNSPEHEQSSKKPQHETVKAMSTHTEPKTSVLKEAIQRGPEEEAEEPKEELEEPQEESQDEPAELPASEGEEKDISAKDISEHGEEMIKEMVAEEHDEGTVLVATEAPPDYSGDDDLHIAAKKLFDEPAAAKHGHDLDPHGATFEVDEGHFGEEMHEISELHAADKRMDQHVHFILLLTPVLVLSSVAYFFCISSIEIPMKFSYDMSAGIQDKLYEQLTGWRRFLGRIIEHPVTNFSILLCIVIDLMCAGTHDLLHATDLLNPKYHVTRERVIHITHATSIYLLCGFLVEQLLHIVCFGKMYFYKFWYVCDLCTVYISLIGETVLNEQFGDIVSFLIMLRLWKVTNVVFDIFLASHETAELHEKILKKKEKIQRQLFRQTTPPSPNK